VLGRLILLFTLVPVVELALLIWIGDRIGFLPTVALILVTGSSPHIASGSAPMPTAISSSGCS
jgi:hypothetical protein